jgi:hypothetical protein
MASDITPGSARFAWVRARFARIALGLRHVLDVSLHGLEFFLVAFASGIGLILMFIYIVAAHVSGHKPTVAHAKRERNTGFPT